MFAVDTMLPINTLFFLFILLCLGACLIGLTQTAPGDPADDAVPDSFRDMPGLTDGAPRSNGHTTSVRRDGLNGDAKKRKM